jgi:7-cyano-7-deazaguanine synthase
LEAIVLLSGGLDSVVNLKYALDENRVVLAITFDYGQTAFDNEKRAAEACARRYGISHRVVRLPWYRTLVSSPLLGDGEPMRFDAGLPPDKQRLLREAWIPNRNCVFISIGAAFGEAMGADKIVVGLNREEAEVFPDNSRAFLDSMNVLLGKSTLTGVEVYSYTWNMAKREILEAGLRIGAPLELVYSCYKPSRDQLMCGRCQSCVRLRAALRESGLGENVVGGFEA